MRSFDYFIRFDSLGLFINLVRDVFGCWSSVRHVVFDPEVGVGTTRVVASGQKNSACGLVLPDDIGGSGSGQNRVFSDYKLLYTVGRAYFKNSLHGFRREKATVASNYESRILCLDGIKDCLYKVLCVVLKSALVGLSPDMYNRTSCWKILTLCYYQYALVNRLAELELTVS